MGHPQTPTPVVTDNTANGKSKQKRPRAIDMIFYWVRDIIQQNHFHIFWDERKKNLADYFTKHHPIWHHRTMRTIFLKPTRKYIENSKDQRNGTG